MFRFAVIASHHTAVLCLRGLTICLSRKPIALCRFGHNVKQLMHRREQREM